MNEYRREVLGKIQLEDMNDTELREHARKCRHNAQRLLNIAAEMDRLVISPGNIPQDRARSRFEHVDFTQGLARAIRLTRQTRVDHFDPEFFEEPAWNMLLQLYERDAVNRSWYLTKQVIDYSGVPPTTALRWVKILVEQGYLERGDTALDQRHSLLRFTERGMKEMYAYLYDVTQHFEALFANFIPRQEAKK